MTKEENLRWKKLDVLDSKTSALLRLAGIVMSVLAIPLVMKGDGEQVHWIAKLTFGFFLASSFLSLFVLAVSWEPSKWTVIRRTIVYWFISFLTAAGLGCLGLIVYGNAI